MTQHFVACDRDQELLLPPNLRDWLPEGHLANFLVDAVEEMNLDGSTRSIGPMGMAGRRMSRG